MQWRGRRQSGNVVDRRGARVAGTLGGGGLVLALLYFLLGGDPSALMDGGGVDRGPPTGPEAQAQREFVAVVLADTEDVWNDLFRRSGKRYQEPKLVLFSGAVRSACGTASSAVGPFYCPADGQVYLDFDFFEDLQRKLGAEGDFARAYVIAHEVGHHVQNLMGTSGRVQAQRQRIGEREANRLSVLLELQADCYAGVYAHQTQRTKRVLEPGDLEEALGAASAVGDDRLQRRSGGAVVPDSFTHGSSAQRVAWFRRGFESGDPEACDTFGGSGTPRGATNRPGAPFRTLELARHGPGPYLATQNWTPRSGPWTHSLAIRKQVQNPAPTLAPRSWRRSSTLPTTRSSRRRSTV